MAKETEEPLRHARYGVRREMDLQILLGQSARNSVEAGSEFTVLWVTSSDWKDVGNLSVRLEVLTKNITRERQRSVSSAGARVVCGIKTGGAYGPKTLRNKAQTVQYQASHLTVARVWEEGQLRSKLGAWTSCLGVISELGRDYNWLERDHQNTG